MGTITCVLQTQTQSRLANMVWQRALHLDIQVSAVDEGVSFLLAKDLTRH